MVCQISLSFGPTDQEVALSSAIVNPAAAHVHGFGVTLSDGVIGNAICGAVVDLSRCWTLREAHFVKCDSDGFSVFAIVEETCELALGGGGHDFLEFVCSGQDGTIVRWWRVVRRWWLRWIRGTRAEKEVTTDARPAFGFRETGTTTVNVKAHVTCMEADFSIGITGGTVQEVNHSVHGFLGSVRDGSSNGAERHEHGFIDGAGAE